MDAAAFLDTLSDRMSLLVTFDAPVDEDSASDHNPGRPLGERICKALTTNGLSAGRFDEHASYAWSWICKIDRAEWYVLLGFRDDETGRWLLNYRPRFKLLARFARARYENAEAALARAIDSVLSSDSTIANVRWHERKKFDRGDEQSWRSHP